MIPRFPECSGQPGDAVSAKTQVEVKETPERLHLPEEDCPEISKIETTEKLVSVDDPNVLVGPSLYGHLLAGLSWECLVVLREHNRFRCTWMIGIKNVRKSCQNGRYVDHIAKQGRFRRPSVLARQTLLGMRATSSPEESKDW